jgi:hypothetical protein
MLVQFGLSGVKFDGYAAWISLSNERPINQHQQKSALTENSQYKKTTFMRWFFIGFFLTRLSC